MSSIFRDSLVEADGTLLADHTPSGGIGDAFTWVDNTGGIGELKSYSNKLFRYTGFKSEYYLSEDIAGDYTLGIILQIDTFARTNASADIELIVNYDPSDDSGYHFEVFNNGGYIAWILYNWDSSYSRDGRLPVSAYGTEMLVQLRFVNGVAYGLINGAVVASTKADVSEAPVGTKAGIWARGLERPSSLGGFGLGQSYFKGPMIVDQPQVGEQQYSVGVYGDNYNTGFDLGEELSLHNPTIGDNGGATHESLDTFAWEKGLAFLVGRANLHTGNCGTSNDGMHGTTDSPTGSHYQANGSTHGDDHVVSMTSRFPLAPQAGSQYGVVSRVPISVTGSEPLNGWGLTIDDDGVLLLQHWEGGAVTDSATITMTHGVTSLVRTDYENFTYAFNLNMPHTISLLMLGEEVLGMMDGLAIEALILSGATETGGLPGILGQMLESVGTDPVDRIYSTHFAVDDPPVGLFLPPVHAPEAGEGPLGGGGGPIVFQPYELYYFAQDDQVWAYTNREGVVVFQGTTYLPIEIKRTSFSFGSDRGDAGIEVTLPRNCPLLATMYDGTTPGSVSLIIIVSGRQDPDGMEHLPIFIGRVAGLVSEKGVGKLSVRRIQDEDEEQIPRKAIQPTCPNMLYDVNCRASMADFSFSLTIDAISGRTYTLSGADHIEPGSTYYQNGFIQKGVYRAFVEFQSGPVLRTMSPLPTAAVADVITAVAGCDRTRTMCRDKFDNVDNFLGFPLIPGRNPWIVGLA